jgi:hypothetical protein
MENSLQEAMQAVFFKKESLWEERDKSWRRFGPAAC